jgi:hypothetical protein
MVLQTLQPVRRTLTDAERRLLRARIAGLRRTHASAPARVQAIAGAIVGLLWVATLLASDSPWMVVTAFWLVVGGGLVMWAARDARRDAAAAEAQARGLESALRRDAADEYIVRASRFAELEEVEDEGACYAFELDGTRLVFVCGQQFYPASRFPSLDFSIVEILDEADRVADMTIDKRGAKAHPDRVVPVVVREHLEVPEHLEVRTGTVAALEQSLQSAE